jgi:hypothetical protein
MQQYQQQPPPQAAPPPANPRLQEALALVDLLQGEQVYFSLQADGLFLGVSPLAKLMAAFNAFLLTVTGGHFRVFLIVTNQRLLVIRSSAVWCGCGRMKLVRAMALASVKEVASEKATQMCCIHSRIVQVHSMTERWNLAIKKLGDEDIRKFVTNLSGVIVAHSTRAGV